MARLLVLVLVALLVPAGTAVAALHPRAPGGTAPGPGVASPANPCTGPSAATLLCPNLKMGTPVDLYAQIGKARTLLRATNRIQNWGAGPMELRGKRRRPLRAFRMTVTQGIKKRGGGRLLRKTGGELFFKPIPGQYRYWKFVDAASLEIWSLDAAGAPLKRIRRSPKQVYCLRDLLPLEQRLPSAPRKMVYPACNQNPDKRRVTLGTSVGWVDRYPASYYQQYVDVTGLEGRFAYVMTADPKNHLAESDESDNSSYTIVDLPVKRQGYLPGY